MGMSCDCLTVVFDAILMFYQNCCMHLLHMVPYGFISVEHLNLIQRLLESYKWRLGLVAPTSQLNSHLANRHLTLSSH